MADLMFTKLVIDGKSYAIPEATTEQKGLMTPEMVTKVNDLAAAQEGSITESQVKTIADKAASDALDVFATKVSDDKVVNTFKEIVDYVAENKAGSADMIADITKLKADVADRVVKETGKGLSANDYSNEEKKKVADAATKLAGMAEGATRVTCSYDSATQTLTFAGLASPTA